MSDLNFESIVRTKFMFDTSTTVSSFDLPWCKLDPCQLR